MSGIIYDFLVCRAFLLYNIEKGGQFMLRDTIRKLSLELLGSAAIAVVVSLILTVILAGLLPYAAGRVFLSVILILMYVAFIYSPAWREGNRDPNRIKYGHMGVYMKKGLVSGLLASIPFFVFYLLLAASAAFNNNLALMRAIYNIVNIQYVNILNILPSPYLYFITLLPLPLVSWGAYHLGFHNYSILYHLTYKSRPSKKTQP